MAQVSDKPSVLPKKKKKKEKIENNQHTVEGEGNMLHSPTARCTMQPW
jgi:hypothetical protein